MSNTDDAASAEFNRAPMQDGVSAPAESPVDVTVEELSAWIVSIAAHLDDLLRNARVRPRDGTTVSANELVARAFRGLDLAIDALAELSNS